MPKKIKISPEQLADLRRQLHEARQLVAETAKRWVACLDPTEDEDVADLEEAEMRLTDAVESMQEIERRFQ